MSERWRNEKQNCKTKILRTTCQGLHCHPFPETANRLTGLGPMRTVGCGTISEAEMGTTGDKEPSLWFRNEMEWKPGLPGAVERHLGEPASKPLSCFGKNLLVGKIRCSSEKANQENHRTAYQPAPGNREMVYTTPAEHTRLF